MGFVGTSARRPIAVLMITLGFVLFGAVSCSNLEVTLLPDLNYPTLTVRTDYVGAAPAEVETLLSKPVEEALGIVKNLREVRSVSRAGQSDVVLEFAWGTEMDFAVLDVRERLDALELPDEASRPLVLRFDPSVDVGPPAAGAEAVVLPLTVVDVDTTDPLAAAYATALTLVRPDQHVAWRGDALPDDAGALVDRVRGAAR